MLLSKKPCNASLAGILIEACSSCLVDKNTKIITKIVQEKTTQF